MLENIVFDTKVHVYSIKEIKIFVCLVKGEIPNIKDEPQDIREAAKNIQGVPRSHGHWPQSPPPPPHFCSLSKLVHLAASCQAIYFEHFRRSSSDILSTYKLLLQTKKKRTNTTIGLQQKEPFHFSD